MATRDRTDPVAYVPAGWRDIETAPRDGRHFLAHCIDLVDEYDEDDRLIARAVPTPTVVLAYWVDWLGGLVEYPYSGSILQGRRYTLWHPIPALPDPQPGRSS